MIEQNYCGKVELKHGGMGAVDRLMLSGGRSNTSHSETIREAGRDRETDGTKTAHTPEKPRESLASPTGFELVSVVTENPGQPLSVREWNKTKRRA